MSRTAAAPCAYNIVGFNKTNYTLEGVLCVETTGRSVSCREHVNVIRVACVLNGMCGCTAVVHTAVFIPFSCLVLRTIYSVLQGRLEV